MPCAVSSVLALAVPLWLFVRPCGRFWPAVVLFQAGHKKTALRRLWLAWAVSGHKATPPRWAGL